VIEPQGALPVRALLKLAGIGGRAGVAIIGKHHAMPDEDFVFSNSPVVTNWTSLTEPANGPATAIGIPAPTDASYSPSQ
jgi:hypothetical protein